MRIFDAMARTGHEQLVFCHDRHTGLRAIIAIHDTSAGPARGGTRYMEYPDEDAAITDVLRLSEAMSYKFAVAGVDYGGGKAVVLKHHLHTRDERLAFRALGRFIETLGGRFGTGPDIGTGPQQMQWVREETAFVDALPGGPDSNRIVAYGAYLGIGACLREVYGSAAVDGRTVAVQGLGGVGLHLVRFLRADGARVVATDVAAERCRLAAEAGAEIVPPEAIYDVECDLFSPNAVGGVLNAQTVPRLRCRAVAGAANNQLADDEAGRALHERGILFAPDYVVSSASPYAILGPGEFGWSVEECMQRCANIPQTLELIFHRARNAGEPPFAVAAQIARERIRTVGALRQIALGRPVPR